MDKQKLGGGLLTAVGIVVPIAISAGGITLSQNWTRILLVACVIGSIIAIVLLFNGMKDVQMGERGKISGNRGIARRGEFIKLNNGKGLDVTDNVSLAPTFMDANDIEDVTVKRNRHIHLDPDCPKDQANAHRKFFGGFSFSRGDHIKK